MKNNYDVIKPDTFCNIIMPKHNNEHSPANDTPIQRQIEQVVTNGVGFYDRHWYRVLTNTLTELDKLDNLHIKFALADIPTHLQEQEIQKFIQLYTKSYH